MKQKKLDFETDRVKYTAGRILIYGKNGEIIAEIKEDKESSEEDDGSIDLGTYEHLTIDASPEKNKRILRNLLKNKIKFEGGQEGNHLKIYKRVD